MNHEQTDPLSPFDYNALGQEYISFAAKRQSLAAKVLQAHPARVIETMQGLVQERLGKAADERAQLKYLLSAFERLDGMFRQVDRIGGEVDRLIAMPRWINSELQSQANSPSDIITLMIAERTFAPPLMMMIPASNLYVDYENFLGQAFTTLELLAAYFTLESTGKAESYLRSRRAIYNLQPPDIRADYVWSDLERTNQLLSTTLVRDNDFDPVRNLLTHLASAPALTDLAFVLHWIDNEHVLAFDNEIVTVARNSATERRFYLIKTVHDVCAAVSWTFAQVVRRYMSRTKHGAIIYDESRLPGAPIEAFVPNWKNPFAPFSAHIDEGETGTKYSSLRIGVDGVQVITRHLNAGVRSYIVKSPSR